MPPDLAELTRRGYEAMNRGDFDNAARALHPEVRWRAAPGMPESQDGNGVEAVKAIWAAMVEPFEQFNFETREFVDLGELSFHEIRLSAVGRGSGAPVEMTWFQVAHFDQNGLVTEFENYLDRVQAREAAGLSAE
jgi:ketosteroid isomerase-like protein